MRFHERSRRVCGAAGLHARTSSARRGVVLYIVAIVLVILALGGTSLLILMRTEHEATLTDSGQVQLAAAGDSLVAAAIALCELTPDERRAHGGLANNPEFFRQVPIATTATGSVSNVSATFLAPVLSGDAIAGIQYGLSNESSRLHLGSVLEWDEAEPGTGRQILLKLPGMTPEMADSLLDWIDADESPRPLGAEAAWYHREQLPYSPRNALPVFLDELLLVRNVTRRELYRNNTDFTYTPEAGEENVPIDLEELDAQPLARDARELPWSLLLTVFSAEKDVDPHGVARIDLNGEDLAFLYREISDRFDRETARFVVLARQYGLTADAGSARTARAEGARDVSESGEDPDFSLPAKYQFQTPLDLIGTQVRIPGQPRRLWPRSPFPATGGDHDRLLLWLDIASTSRTTVITGRVNVNEAPRVLLEAIPGLTPVMAGRIIQRRPRVGEEVPREYRHPIWLWQEKIVDLATMKQLWPKVTCGGDVFRGQVIAFSDRQATHVRREVVLDSTVQPPRIVFNKDLTMYGRGWPRELLIKP